MNLWQKICVVVGVLAVALVYTVFPVEVSAIGSGNEIIISTHFPATTMRAIAVIAGTAAVATLLGILPQKTVKTF